MINLLEKDCYIIFMIIGIILICIFVIFMYVCILWLIVKLIDVNVREIY